MTIRAYRDHWPLLAVGVYVDSDAVVIGDVSIGEDSSVWPGAVIRGDVNTIRIGCRSNIQDGAVLHVTHCSPTNPTGFALVLGDEVTVGHHATLHGCSIGDRVLIGMGATVLDGAVIESAVVVAAGTLVPPGKRLVSGYLYMGQPARQQRPLSQEELNYFSYTAANYVRWKDDYLSEQLNAQQ
ncbi:MAG: gamma carbonic anhydrase family protein [Gammaproteobacteria bacterium]|nr:gamma carbonic anhydrase family protein [Gammaproteobacteria bacterium]